MCASVAVETAVFVTLAFGMAIIIVIAALMGLGKGGKEERKEWEEASRRLRGRLFLREDEPSRLVFPWHGVEAEARASGGRIELKIPLAGTVPRPVAASVAVLNREPTAGEKLPEGFNLLNGSRDDWQLLARGKGSELLKDLAADGGLIDFNPEVLEVNWKPKTWLTGEILRGLQIVIHAKYAFAGDTGVRVIGVEGVERGECQVCGVELGGSVVRCSRCATPHHADCWEYMGVCSTYGCGSRDSRS
jgi:hypothetical protein